MCQQKQSEHLQQVQFAWKVGCQAWAWQPDMLRPLLNLGGPKTGYVKVLLLKTLAESITSSLDKLGTIRKVILEHKQLIRVPVNMASGANDCTEMPHGLNMQQFCCFRRKTDRLDSVKLRGLDHYAPQPEAMT